MNGDRGFKYVDMHKEFMLRNNKVIILSRILISYSFIALTLTCFGLFGISWYAVRHRTREIAIRKVHGASNWEIVWLLNRSFLWQILVAYIIAIPITWLLMQHWLEQFAYRISATQWNFLTPVLIVLVITTITITIHSYLSARTNPVNSLKLNSKRLCICSLLLKKNQAYRNHNKDYVQSTVCSKEFFEYKYPYQDCRKRFQCTQ